MINIELDSNVLVKFICQSIINACLKCEYTNMSQPSLAVYLLVSWDIKCKVYPQLKRQSSKPDILNTDKGLYTQNVCLLKDMYDTFSASSPGVLGAVNPGLYRELWRHREILARSFPDFARTTGQDRTPRD